jgi:hypothetical protein
VRAEFELGGEIPGRSGYQFEIPESAQRSLFPRPSVAPREVNRMGEQRR